MSFQQFQERLKTLRSKADEYADAAEVHKSLDTVEKAWESAAKAVSLAEVPQVKAALEASQRSADVLAYNILNADTSKVSPAQLLESVVKYQALEQVRSAFAPTAAIALEEAVAAGLEQKPE